MSSQALVEADDMVEKLVKVGDGEVLKLREEAIWEASRDDDFGYSEVRLALVKERLHLGGPDCGWGGEWW